RMGRVLRPSPEVLLADGPRPTPRGGDGEAGSGLPAQHGGSARTPLEEGAIMSSSERLQRKIDAYLAELRRSLGELPAEDVQEILREIRGHILERAEASGE